MMIAAVLVMAACGGASESSVGTRASSAGSVPALGEAARAAVEVSADALISTMGDEQTALAAVLLAGDRGYGVDQIVSAGVEGRLQPGGLIMSADGTPLTPDYQPSEILDDDVTADASEASGFRSPPESVRLSFVLNHMRQSYDTDRGSLVAILLFFEMGYSLEQIVLAVLADGSVEQFRGCLLDENGNVIGPEQAPTETFVGWCNAATSTTVTPSHTTAPSVADPEGTESLDEPEGDGSSDEGHLSGTWTMWWVNANGQRSDAFTIRFNGVDSGTLEILEDETEIDTFFTVDGDLVTFGFTLLRPLDPEYYTQESVPAISFFIGEFEDANSVEGLWEREGYSCSPDTQPQCNLGTNPSTHPAGLIRES